MKTTYATKHLTLLAAVSALHVTATAMADVKPYIDAGRTGQMSAATAPDETRVSAKIIHIQPSTAAASKVTAAPLPAIPTAPANETVTSKPLPAARAAEPASADTSSLAPTTPAPAIETVPLAEPKAEPTLQVEPEIKIEPAITTEPEIETEPVIEAEPIVQPAHEPIPEIKPAAVPASRARDAIEAETASTSPAISSPAATSPAKTPPTKTLPTKTSPAKTQTQPAGNASAPAKAAPATTASATTAVTAPESLFQGTLTSMRSPLAVALESQIAGLRADMDKDDPDTDDVEAIARWYEDHDYTPLFTNGDDVNARGKSILLTLSKAAEEGLEPGAYVIETDRPAAREVSILRAAMRYARHAYSGRADTKRIHPLVTVEPPTLDTNDIIQGLTDAADAGQYLANLNPPHNGYRGLRTLLAKMRAEEQKDEQVIMPSGKLLRPGARDERVLLLRKRLNVPVAMPAETASDMTASITPAAQDRDNQDGADQAARKQNMAQQQNIDAVNAAARDADLYDKELVAAVKAFQASEGLTQDGIIGPNTLEFLNRGRAGDIAAIISNMERWRWLPRELGDHHVVVNVPEFIVRIIDNGVVHHSTRVVVGKRRNQTPIFSDEMEYVDVNPSWNVPRSIAVKEMLPQIQADPNYFSKRNFQVVSQSGKVIDPRSVNWAAYDGRSLPYRFRQPPGRGNALGRIKFMFPNKHHVYLHDTPSKKLFERQSRAFSHGCVRVKNPIEFAHALLERDTKVSSASISSRLKSGKPGELRLSRHIPVHLVYFNVWANEDGTLGRAADIYGHDAATQAALNDDYSAYKRASAAHRAQKVANFSPKAAAQARARAAEAKAQRALVRQRQYERQRRGIFGGLFSGNR